MPTHPVFLRLEDRPCLVVGGDAPAADKAGACLAAGARVTVVAPDPAPRILGWAADGRLGLLRREYRTGDLAEMFLAYASTRDPALIAHLTAEADRCRVLLNVIDVPDACTFLSPAVVRRGDLQVAVGTGGASPGLSARLRAELEGRIGPEYGPFVAILGAVRATLAGDPARASRRGEVVAALLDSPLLELVRTGRHDEIDVLLGRVAGSGCTLGRLGVALGSQP
jgi:precorrin-2 dehydrogenase/sirohydrochlorin ferrochelatase